MSVSIPSISIPSQQDLWLNVDSDISILGWYKVMRDRRKKRIELDMRKGEIKTCKGWKKIFSQF